MADWKLPLCDTVKETHQNNKALALFQRGNIGRTPEITKKKLKLDPEGNISSPDEEMEVPST